MKLDTILVPLDGSSSAEAAVGTAAELAEAAGAQIILLRTVDAHLKLGSSDTSAQAAAAQEADDYLAAVGDRLDALGIENVETSVWCGAAASAIVGAASRFAADLIVMTTHGRSGLRRLILGSVAESVLRGTRTSILLVRAPEAPAEAPGDEGDVRSLSEVAGTQGR